MYKRSKTSEKTWKCRFRRRNIQVLNLREVDVDLLSNQQELSGKSRERTQSDIDRYPHLSLSLIQRYVPASIYLQ